MPKQQRRRNDNVVTMPTLDAPGAPSAQTDVSDADVARRAYELYCDRGREDGHDIDDWLNAERKLRGGANATAA